MSNITLEDVDLDVLLREREFRLCAPDWNESSTDELVEAFVYYCKTYVKIRHPERGRIPFDLRPAQVETIRAWIGERNTIALKARQIGFSTLVSNFAFWLAFFYEDRTIIMLSRTERDSIKLLAHAKYAYRFFPEWLKLRGPVVTPTQSKLEFTNESIVESLPSASDPARGNTAFLIVVDEMGQLPNSEDAWAAIEPVSDVGGRVIMLGTANGEGNLFHTLWLGSHGFGNGTNRFVSIFHPWSAGDRDQAWYEAKKRELPPWQLAQEYPDNPDEAFLRSGRPVFNVDKLRELETSAPIARGFLDDWEGPVLFYEDADELGGGPLRIWQYPQTGHVYVIGADVAEGLEHGDYSVAHVIDARERTVVAVWHGHIDPDVFGEKTITHLSAFYNHALSGVESNNHGLTTLKAMVRAKHKNIYHQRRQDKRHAAPTDTLGWRTTTATKPLAIDELGGLLRDLELVLPDAETIGELRTYVREGDGKMHGSPHDDRVMALAIAVQMLKYAWMPEFRVKSKAPVGSFAWLMDQLYVEEKPKRTAIGSFGVRMAA